MIAAAQAASSADTTPAGNTAGDTTPQGGKPAPAIPDATGQPAAAAAATVPASAAVTGEAPEARIVAATKNAREQATREVEARYEAFKGLDPAEVKLAMQVLSELRSDTAKFHQELGQRINGGQPAAAATAPEEYPAADLVSKDGTMKTYTDATMQKVLDVHGKRVKAELMAELKPYLNYTDSEQKRTATAEAEAARDRFLTEALTEARQMPHFTKANEPAILEEMEAIPLHVRKAIGPVAVIHRAYNSFLHKKVFPTVDSEADKRLRDEYSRKAAAGGGSAHPTQQGGDPKPTVIRDGDVDGLARHMARLAEAATAQ